MRAGWFTLGMREHLSFRSGSIECDAWHYPGTNGACVVMAGGFAVTKEPGTDVFAARFHAAGYSVLAFDYRRTGGSGGRPRQVLRVREQLADWHAAIHTARLLPGVDPARIALWSFSVSAGHLFPVAARDRQLAAVIAQTPNADGPAATRNALRFQQPRALLRVVRTGLLDVLGSLAGRPPRLLPLVGAPGEVAMLTTPDSADTTRALDPDGRYPDWQQTVAARSALRIGSYRPGRYAAKVRCPVLVVAADQDQTALAKPGVQAAHRAPQGELLRLPGNHYAPFLAAHEQAVVAELAFLRRVLLNTHPTLPSEVSDATGTPTQPTGEQQRSARHLSDVP